MSLPHAKGYASAEEAMRSKRYLANPGAELDTSCPCGTIHVRMPREAHRAPVKAPADTGPSRAVRALVLARDGYACAACGKNITGAQYSLQHRVARGMGGTSDPVASLPSNLVTLCGSATSPGCHRLAEDRDPIMGERGFWIEHGRGPVFDPRLVPVFYSGGERPGFVAWLADDGGLLFDPPEVAA